MFVNRRALLLEARRLREAAEKATNPETRAGLIEMANRYEKLASQEPEAASV
jgi:hypothetical protein